jgi:PAS domain S-box-containing protein
MTEAPDARAEGPHTVGAESYDTPDAQELHHLLVASVRDYAIFALDPTGHILTWNPGAHRFKGYTTAEAVGKHFSIFYPPEDIATGKPAHELIVAEQEGRFEDEGWRIRKDGSRFWANVVITAIRWPDGRLRGFAKVTRDLTERRLAQDRAIADASRVVLAEAANRAKADFLAAMSHELRTPLNAIGGYVDIIAMGLRGPVTEEQRQDLDRIRRSQKHLLAIINDLLNFSRIEAGQIKYNIESMALARVIDTVTPMVLPQAVAKGLTFRRGPCAGCAVARADFSKVEQILINLLSNAVKFTPDGGSITVSCTAQGETVCLVVQDTGIGIPPEKVTVIFEPFVQLGRTLTTSHEGTGLGLAISRDLARVMGGELSAVSSRDQGATFTLVLPRDSAAQLSTSGPD